MDLGLDFCAESRIRGTVEIEGQGHVVLGRDTGDYALGMEGARVEEGGEEAGDGGGDVANLLVADVIDADCVGVELGGVSCGASDMREDADTVRCWYRYRESAVMQTDERRSTCLVLGFPLQQYLFPNGCNPSVILHTDNFRKHMAIMLPVLSILSLAVLGQVNDVVRTSVVIGIVIEVGACSGVGEPLFLL